MTEAQVGDRSVSIDIIYGDIPDTVSGAVTSQDSSRYTILLNSNKSEEEQAAAFLHECLHIYHGDLSSNRSADDIEAERHKELISLLTILKEGDER